VVYENPVGSVGITSRGGFLIPDSVKVAIWDRLKFSWLSVKFKTRVVRLFIADKSRKKFAQPQPCG
jgi:hypothetical protein